MSAPKFKTFCCTHRPRDGVSTECIQKFESYLKKKCDYYYLITEKEDAERHIHSCFIRRSEATRSTVTLEIGRAHV